MLIYLLSFVVILFLLQRTEKGRLLSYLINIKLGKFFFRDNIEEASLYNDKILKVPYKFRGNKYDLYLHFSKKKALEKRSITVQNENSILNLNLQSGISCSVTPSDLDYSSGKIICSRTKKEISVGPDQPLSF